MSKAEKKTVELQPSRIRRDPVRVDVPTGPAAKAQFDPRERETWVVVIGVVLFAVALTIIIFGFSDVTN